MIDLRSDTVTTPTPGMRQAMAAAEVGDDVYGEDPSITALENQVAQLLGHEAGLFCVTGSMANLLGIWCLAEPGGEVLCDAQAHVVRAEMGAHAALHGVTMRTFDSSRGVVDPDQVLGMLSLGTRPYIVETQVVALENTHNFSGGTVQPLDAVQAVAAGCHERGVRVHLDGARLANAQVATGVPMRAWAEQADTVSLCLSKGLGAPVGSVLVSSAKNIALARVQRKRLGGGWRQAGILAAAGRYALEHQLDRLADDHRSAQRLAAVLAERAPGAVLSEVETNIVVIGTGERPATVVAAEAYASQVAVSVVGPRTIRAVTHLGVSEAEAVAAGEELGLLLG